MKKDVSERLILVISEHRILGWRINVYSAHFQENESIHILGVPSIEEEIQQGTSETEIELIRTMEEVSNELLLKAHTKKSTVTNVKNEIKQEVIDNIIRPKLELNTRKVLDLASQTDVPIYLRENLKSKVLYERHRVELLSSPAHCLFKFIKDEEGMRYFLSLTNGEEEISLLQKPTFILSNDPCIILSGKNIHRVADIESKRLVPFFSKTHISVPAEHEKMYINNFIVKTMQKFKVRIEGIEMPK